METAPTSIEVLLRPTPGQSDEPSDLCGSLSPTSVYSTWQSQAVTHPIMNRARRCLTSVMEPITMSERRIPYIGCIRGPTRHSGTQEAKGHIYLLLSVLIYNIQKKITFQILWWFMLFWSIYSEAIHSRIMFGFNITPEAILS